VERYSFNAGASQAEPEKLINMGFVLEKMTL